MRKLTPYLLSFFLLLVTVDDIKAQSFSMAYDTVWIITSSPTIETYPDSVTNTTAAPISVAWKVIATDFPTDWKIASGICDPSSCYSDLNLWPIATTKNFILPTGVDRFHLSIDYSATTSVGCYYVQVRLHNATITTDTAIATYITCKSAPAAASTSKWSTDVLLYPTVATNAITLEYNTASDIKRIAVYSIAGKIEKDIVPTNNTTNINIEHLPAGVYFVQFTNGSGQIVSNQKFIKQ